MHVIIAIGIVIGIIIAILVALWIIEEYGGMILGMMLFVGFDGFAIMATLALISAIQKDDVVGGTIAFILASISGLIAGSMGWVFMSALRERLRNR